MYDVLRTVFCLTHTTVCIAKLLFEQLEPYGSKFFELRSCTSPKYLAVVKQPLA
jgi:hypothetical protein